MGRYTHTLIQLKVVPIFELHTMLIMVNRPRVHLEACN